MNSLHRTWQAPGSGGSLALRRPGKPWAQATLQPALWITLVGTLCVLALLLAFRQVVLQGVQQSESRHRASAAHADGVWRCNALRTVSQRAACRAQLDAAAMPTDRPDATAMTIANVERASAAPANAVARN